VSELFLPESIKIC